MSDTESSVTPMSGQTFKQLANAVLDLHAGQLLGRGLTDDERATWWTQPQGGVQEPHLLTITEDQAQMQAVLRAAWESKPVGAPHVSLYGQALDEIYALRTLLAYEASALQTHLGFKRFPKSRRAIAERSVEQMTRAARGDGLRVLRSMGNSVQRWGREQAGVSHTLTRASWEAEHVERT